MLSTDNFPGCCNAVVIYNFGGTANSLWGDNNLHKDFEDFIKWAVDAYKRVMIVATTNNEQTEVNRVLKEQGFQNIGWMKKENHPNTAFTMWYKVPQYNAEYVDRYWVGRELPDV